MERPLKILFASSEVSPFSKTGGLADVSGSLPKALSAMGCDLRVITPFYRCVADGGFDVREVSGGAPGRFLKSIFGFDILENRSDNLTTYFIDNRKFFSRGNIYGGPRGDYPDNALRFGSFARSVIGSLEAIDFRPDLIHCNDWQTALIPFYLNVKPGDTGPYRGIKTLFTIHNLAYQGLFPGFFAGLLGIPRMFLTPDGLEFHGKMSFMKSGILYSDAVSTVSRRYAEEITTPEYGCGLEGLLATRKDALYGIPNGADYDVWSPEKDCSIIVNYGPGTVQNKFACKKDLLEYAGLRVSADKPLIGCVSRLVHQKGMDLLAGIMRRIAASGAGVVILGTGSADYNKIFDQMADKFPGVVSVCREFNDELAHKIEAGSDIFVMPSRYEPCGLNQMYSIKYGTIPVVRATGGLDDVIIDFDENPLAGNGFKFSGADEESLFGALTRAFRVYDDKTLWRKLVLQAMSCDFSWERSAGEYLKLYEKITSKSSRA